MINFVTTITSANSSLWDLCVDVPNEIVKSLLKDGNTRFLVTINGGKCMHKALIHDGQGGRYIIFNKDIQKEYNLKEGKVVNISIKSDDSTYGMPLPEEMEILMDQDPEGSDFFHSLSMGKQRSLLYIIGKPKTSDTRLHKAVVILDYLKVVQGKLDFKELNIAFKESRRL